MKTKVHVYLKPGVLDVQGKAIEGALHDLGWGDVANVRVGKTIEFEVAGAGQRLDRELLGRAHVDELDRRGRGFQNVPQLAPGDDLLEA